MEFRSLLIGLGVMLLSPAAVTAQDLIGRYTATIAPEDRRSSKGVVLTHPAAILAQDRANFHRFGVRQPGDTADGVFTTPNQRAEIPNLVAAGSMTAEARAILQGQSSGRLQVDILGSGGRPALVQVTVVGAGGETEQPAASQAGSATAVPTFGAATPTPTAQTAQTGKWTFSTGPAGWRAIAGVAAAQGARVSLECSRPGTDPARYPGPGSIRPHEPGFLNLILSGAPFDGQGAGAKIGIAIDGRSFGEAPMAPLGTSPGIATNVPRNHALIAQLRGGTELWLDAATGRVKVPLAGAAMAIGRLLATCDQPIDANTTTAAVGTITPSSPAIQVPGAAPGGAVGADGLARLEGRVAFWAGGANARSFIGTSLENTEHDDLLSRGLFFAALTAGSDDLGASLASVPSEQHLQSLFQHLPKADKHRIVEMALTLQDRPQADRDRCLRATGNRIWYCLRANNLTEFDRRRVTALLAREIAAVATARAISVPLPAHVICGGQALDQAYDFDTGEIRWARFIDPNSCRQANMPLSSYMANGLPITVDHDFRLEAVMPEGTAVPPDDVERMVLQNQPITGPTGERLYRTHAVTFPAEIRVERREGAVGALGLHPVNVVISRTGPVDLRWTGAPEQVVMSFDAPEAVAGQEAVEPLLSARAIADMLAEAPALDPVAMTEQVSALISGDYSGEMRRFGVRAYNNGAALVINEMTAQSQAAQRLAAAVGAPPDYVAWAQVQSAERGVQDQEVMLILPRPFGELMSDALPGEIAGRKNLEFQLLVDVEAVAQAGGEVGPSLVALARPVEFVATGRDDFNRPVDLGRVALVPVSAPPPTRLFMPDANWFLLRKAELMGQDPVAAFREAYEAAGIGGNDTFARLDAVDAGLELARRAGEAAGDADPWVRANLSLGAYDLDREAYPIRHIQIELPVSDRNMRGLVRIAMPNVQWGGLMLPLAVDEARAMRESLHADANYPARLRLTTGPAAAEGAAPELAVAEVLILPQQRGSQRAAAPTSFMPEEVLLRREPVAGP